VWAVDSQITFQTSSFILRHLLTDGLLRRRGDQAFSHPGPAVWNALPVSICTVADPVEFQKNLLKSCHISVAFSILLTAIRVYLHVVRLL